MSSDWDRERRGAGTGLRGMRERVSAVGGSVEVWRGDGWVVVVTVPTAVPAGAEEGGS